MNNRHIALAGLSAAAPGAFLLFYPVYRRSESLALGCMILGVALSFVLLGWSLWSLHRRPGRALLGLVVCGYCFWQVLVIPGVIMAVKNQREKQQPNQITGANAGERLGFAGKSRVVLSQWPGVAQFFRSAAS